MAKKTNSGIGSAIFKIFRLLALDRQDITAVYIFSIFAGAVALSLPLGIQTIIGYVQAGSLSTSIVILIFLVLLGTFITGLLQVRQLELIEKIEQKLYVRYALDYAQRIPKLDILKLDNYFLPELVNRFFDAPNLQKSLHKLLVDIPTALIQILFSIILLAFYHPFFIAFGFSLIFVIFLILRFTSNRGFETSLETSDYKYKTAAWLEELSRGIKTFKYGRHTTLHMTKMDNILSNYLTARTSHFTILKFQYWTMIVFKLVIIGSMLALGVYLLLGQQLNIGQFVAIDIVILNVLSSAEKLIINLDSVYEALTSVEKLDKVSKAAVEISGKQELSNKAEGIHIVLDKVSFAYPKESPCLQNISFEVKPGEWILLHGDSGSGKSTIFRLLTAALYSTGGSILIDGLPIENYDSSSLRKQMGIILGNQNIFEGTLRENLTLADNEITSDQIMEMSKLTGLITEIQSNKEGLDQMIEPFGRKHTNRQRHQILLTRALLQQNRVMLIEDPFEFLQEQDIQKLVSHIKSTNSTVLIASRSKSYEVYCQQCIELKPYV